MPPPEILDQVHATILYFLTRELYDLSAMCEIIELKNKGIKLSMKKTAFLILGYLSMFNIDVGNAWEKNELDGYIAQVLDPSFSSILTQEDAGHDAIIQKACLSDTMGS